MIGLQENAFSGIQHGGCRLLEFQKIDANLSFGPIVTKFGGDVVTSNNNTSIRYSLRQWELNVPVIFTDKGFLQITATHFFTAKGFYR